MSTTSATITLKLNNQEDQNKSVLPEIQKSHLRVRTCVSVNPSSVYNSSTANTTNTYNKTTSLGINAQRLSSSSIINPVRQRSCNAREQWSHCRNSNMINSADSAAASQTNNMLINEQDYRSPPQENVKSQNEIEPKIQQNRIVSIAPTTDAFSHLSVSQRASLFFQHNDSDKLQHQKVCGKKKEESGSGRVKSRRSWLISHRERVRTQPVAIDEIKQAQSILAAENFAGNKRSDDVMVSETEETSISIADRARLLFAQQTLNNCLNKDSCFSDFSSCIREEDNIKCNVRAMVEKWRSNDLDFEKQRRVSYGDEYTSQEPHKLNISDLPYLRNKISSPLSTKRNSIIVLEEISKDLESVSDQVRQEIQEQQDCGKGDHLTRYVDQSVLAETSVIESCCSCHMYHK